MAKGLGGKRLIREKELLINQGIIISDDLYFANCDLNGLYKMNLNTMECRFISFFPNEPILKNSLYLHADCDKERIVFSPFLAERIAVFNLKTEEFKTYTVPKEYWWNQKECRFLAVKIYGRHAYFYGLKASILRLDMENGEMKFWNAQGLGIDKDLSVNVNFGMQIRQCGEYIYNVVYGMNRIFRFSLLNEQMENYIVDIPDEQLRCVDIMENQICLITNKSISFWNEEKRINYIKFLHKRDSIWKTDCVDKKILISMENELELLAYSGKAENECSIKLNEGQSTRMPYMPNRAFCIGTYKGNLLCFSTHNNSLYIIDKNLNLHERIQMIDSEIKKFENAGDGNIWQDSIVMEGMPSVVTLKYMMNQMCSNEQSVLEEGGAQGNIGEKIYKVLL